MTDHADDSSPKKAAAEKLALLVAQRKAKAGLPEGARGGKPSERAAAALSASKSKPAMRR
jgi:hypothetical protein